MGPERVSESPLESAMYGFVDAYDRAYEDAASRHELSVAQVCVLIRLGEARTMGSLATELQCLPSNITQIVNRLSQRGLVHREPDPRDRRSRLLSLTPAGRRAKQAFEHAFTFARDAEQRLGRKEAEQLARLLAKAMGQG